MSREITEQDCDLMFSTYANAHWGPNWALCVATARNRERYARCVTRAEYASLEREWAAIVHAARVRFGRPHVVGLPITREVIDFLVIEEIRYRHTLVA